MRPFVLVLELYLAGMFAVIVGVDLLVFRTRLWPRLVANIGIIMMFAAVYMRFLRRP